MFKNKLLAGVLLSCVIAVAGCGSNTGTGPENPTGPQVRKLNGAEYIQMGEGTLVATDGSIEGAATIAFVAPSKEDNNYNLEFTLPDKGSLKLIANAEAKLQKGVAIEFIREGNALKVIQNGNDLSAGFEEVDASKNIVISVDVHPHGHGIYWLNGEKDVHANEPFTARPKGTLWGLELKGAKVTKAQIGAPRFIEGEEGGHEDHDR